MGFGIIDTSTLTAIANAIRTKLGVQTTYKPSEMPEAIESISGGGITPTGTKSITANGTYDVTTFASAEVNVPSSGITPTGTKEITANGTNIDVASYAYADVDVPNSYAAGDEGKVVSNGALVAQTSDTVTQNGTVDTTLINSLTVNVSGGGSSGLDYETGTYTAASDGNPTISFTNSHSTAPALVVFVDADSYVNQVAGVLYSFVGLTALFGQGVEISSATTRDAFFGSVRIGSNGTSNTGFKSITTVSDHVTNTGFKPNFDGSTYKCKSGKTYKWIAIWK